MANSTSTAPGLHGGRFDRSAEQADQHVVGYGVDGATSMRIVAVLVIGVSAWVLGRFL